MTKAEIINLEDYSGRTAVISPVFKADGLPRFQVNVVNGRQYEARSTRREELSETLEAEEWRMYDQQGLVGWCQVFHETGQEEDWMSLMGTTTREGKTAVECAVKTIASIIGL